MSVPCTFFFSRCIIAMGLDKQPTPPPKRVSEDGGGQDIRISSTVPLDARKAVNGEDDAIPETSHLEDVETQVREERAAVEGKARDGERQTQLGTAERCCSAVILHVLLYRL